MSWNRAGGIGGLHGAVVVEAGKPHTQGASGVFATSMHPTRSRGAITKMLKKKTTHLALGELLSSHVLHHLHDALIRAELEKGGRSEAPASFCLLLCRKRSWLILIDYVSLSQRRTGRGLFIDFLAIFLHLFDIRGCVHARAYSFFCIESADRRH